MQKFGRQIAYSWLQLIRSVQILGMAYVICHNGLSGAAEKSANAIVSANECEVILTNEVDTIHREIVHFADPFSQYQRYDSIPNELVQVVTSVATPYGESTIGRFYWKRQALTKLQGPKTVPNPSLTLRPSGPTKPTEHLDANGKPSEKYVRKYLAALYADQPVAKESMDMWVASTMSSSQLLQPIIESLQHEVSQDLLELQNVGSQSYFWYVRRGTQELVPARVIDIHLGPTETYISIEWLSENYDGEIRHRYVNTMSQDELKTIVIDGLKTRLQAEEAFLETLSPLEIQTLKLAKKLKIQPFGFSHYERFGRRGGDPLDILSVQGHHYSREAALKVYGDRILNLLTEAERANGNWNIYDVFSKLNTRHAVQIITSRFYDELSFIWAITSDGQLKIAPHAMKDSGNLKPQILRLGAGRRIFTGGTFTFNSQDSISINIDERNYNDGMNFDHDESFDDFVHAVFKTHADLKVENLRAPLSSDYIWSQSTGETRKAKPAANNQILWNPENPRSKPLSYSNWRVVKKLRLDPSLRDLENRLEWARHVLLVHESASIEQALRAAKVLSQRFHPDRVGSEARSLEIVSIVSEARSVYRDYSKSMLKD